jgi:hypothetical protein
MNEPLSMSARKTAAPMRDFSCMFSQLNRHASGCGWDAIEMVSLDPGGKRLAVILAPPDGSVAQSAASLAAIGVDRAEGKIAISASMEGRK